MKIIKLVCILMAVKMKIYHLRRRLTLAVLTAPLLEIHAEIGAPFTNAPPKAELNFKSHGASIWEDEVGKGFRSTTQSFGASAGALVVLHALVMRWH